MYKIIKLQSGACQCHLTYQDGMEEWRSDNFQRAVQSMIEAAEAFNHDSITLKNIHVITEDGREENRRES